MQSSQSKTVARSCFALVLTALLAACGGGGGNPGACSGSAVYCGANNVSQTGTGNPSTPSAATPTVGPSGIVPSNSVAGQCASPRPASVINPATRAPYGDRQGSLTTEKQWIRGFVDETYLFYTEVPAVNPNLYVVGATATFVEPSDNSAFPRSLLTNMDVVETYFNSLRTKLTTASGKPKDRFQFTYSTPEWLALSNSGQSVGFGFQVALLSATPPRRAVIAYTDPGTPAALGNLARGAQFVTVNGVSVLNGDPAVLNEGLFSPKAGTRYRFEVLDSGSTVTRTVELTPTTVTSTPVQNVRTLPAPNNRVGYILFNDHIATSEAQLIAAVNQLKASNNGAGISDLVLDLRYNGGGLLGIASELAFMIAGAPATTGKTFERLSFNDKNPFGITPQEAATPFYAVSQGFSTTRGVALPQLGLGRVFVLTSSGTCSASESVMNSLAGIGVSVIQIGNATCGKPYGFFPEDNCGVTYFNVQFKGVNQLGYGDYTDGLVPATASNQADRFEGCVVADDFTKQLGDPLEGRLATALQYRANRTCTAVGQGASAVRVAAEPEPILGRSPARENRIITR
jgi:carboxyl-terminal processing protease